MTQQLPNADHQYPACGCCGGDTTSYGDGEFYCEDCELGFDEATLTAHFRDPEAPVCGIECDNDWHKRPGAIYPGVSFDCRPCALPKGHTSMHWTGCIALRPERTGA